MKRHLLIHLVAGFIACFALVFGKNAVADMSRKDVENIVHDYIVGHPEVLLEASNAYQQKSVQQTITQNANGIYFSSGSPVVGNPKGSISVVEFFDYQCPYCKKLSPVVTDVVKSDKNLRLVFKELPIFGDKSIYAAKAALAANRQGKYLAMHNALMAQTTPVNEQSILALAKNLQLNIDKMQKDMQDPVLEQELRNNLMLAESMHISGTPALVVSKTPQMVDGKLKLASKNPTLHIGLLSKQQLQSAIALERA